MLEVTEQRLKETTLVSLPEAEVPRDCCTVVSLVSDGRGVMP